MKFSFKRFLSSALAAVMTVSVLSVGMVSSVFADTTNNLKFTDANTIFSGKGDYFFSNTGEKLASSAGAYFTVHVNGDRAKDSGTDFLKFNSKDNDYFIFTTANSASLTINATAGSERTITITGPADYKAGAGENNTIPNTSNRTYDDYKFTLNAPGQYTVKFSGSVQVKEITVVEVAAGTNTISGKVTGIGETEPQGTFSCGLNSFKLAKSGSDYTYSVSELAAGDYEITYTGDDYRMDPVTVNIPKGDNQNITKDLALEVIPQFVGTVETAVTPTVTGNKTVYDFTRANGNRLINSDAADVPANSAFADWTFDNAKAGTPELQAVEKPNCYIELSHTGAKLHDDSAAASPRLNIPYTPTSNKVVISGSVTPTNNIGGNWKLLDFGVVSLASDKSKKLTLTNDSSVDSTDNAGDVANHEIKYEITLDLSGKTASGTVTNGSVSKEFTNVPFIEGKEFNSITAVANNGNSITADNDRGLLIPSVTIIDGEEEASPVTVGSTTANGKTYVFAGVKDGHQTDSGNLVVYGSSTETTAEGIRAKEKVVLETGTVYSSVDGVATPEGVEGYVFAQEVTNSKGTDINLVAVLGDYVSAVGKVSFN